MQSESITKLAQALLAAQAEFSAVPKGSDNPFFKSKYAALPDVVKHTTPVLAKHGLGVSQFVDNVNGEDALTTYLIHSSGEFISHSMLLHLVKDDPQAQGSAITYARRYSYMACLGLVADEDDDGNAASSPRQQSRSPQQVSKPRPASNETPADVQAILDAASADASDSFLVSLAEQWYAKGSLSDKQILAGSKRAKSVLRNSSESAILSTTFPNVTELKPGEEPF